MILVRDVFRLKFGAAREALAAFKDVGDARGIRTPGDIHSRPVIVGSAR